ncbi:hypothetical protein [Rhizobium sp. YK2]|uniref:hypothetical protein n=1 Tax=Rhizobium sp. YK2 TaxID=1860096 RepID=UPI00084C6B49|nr:hypothetical protein [Rhizobium sp. YK2]OEC99630.1 hypothetical protein A9Z06_16840 [Rhizobium sp. YK2]
MNKMTNISSLGGQKILEPDIVPSKPSVITLGGCNLFQSFVPLRDIFDFTHFWRAAIPITASRTVSIDYGQFSDETVIRLLERDATKVVYQRVKAAPDSSIIFEAAADFTNKFLKIGDSFLPDIRSSVFGSEFENVEFKEDSELANAEVISPDSDYYWEVWKYYFDLMYKDLLQERIQRGVQVIFLSRRLCLNELKEGEFVPLPNVREIARRNLILDDIEDFVSQYEGIVMIKSSPDLLYTSEHAIGGAWEFHPHEGYYADLRSKFMEALLPATGKGEKYLASWIADADRNLSKARYSCASLESELDRLQSLLQQVSQNAEQSQSRCDALEKELAGKNEIIASQEKASELLGSEVSDLRSQNARLNLLSTFMARRYTTGKLSLIDKLGRLCALRFEAKQLRKLGFDERKYLDANPDVKNAGMVAETHYLLYGMKEGRKIISTLGIILCSMMMSDYFPSDSLLIGTLSAASTDIETRR